MRRNNRQTNEPCVVPPDAAAVITPLTGFQRDTLCIVAALDETASTGVAISEALDELYEGEVTNGRVYQNLRTLVDANLLAKRPIDGRTNAYAVTETSSDGLRAYAAWTDACVDTVGEPHPFFVV
ncbi:helix-turn-helix transcriptional regulator [Haloprofundus salinisoli]|uniref:helix-turn-helix transcriptional regulator n=1 Tax=Haloprofundus salinisoli TaxID=2876193 RepID=UPI001CCE69D6|nr:helix-turn-helix transcriptional regulator [Haloprofundus salinisoli]